jgi:hypothetical protein
MFFSHNKSANNTFSHGFSAKRTGRKKDIGTQICLNYNSHLVVYVYIHTLNQLSYYNPGYLGIMVRWIPHPNASSSRKLGVFTMDEPPRQEDAYHGENSSDPK